MKGVILAGGKGTRLYPLTAVINKHLVPIGNLPMIEYPLYTLRQIGINSIDIVTGGEHFQDIAKYLTEMHPDVDFIYHAQKKAGGIAQALSLVESSVKGSEIAVILGDNIFSGNFQRIPRKMGGATLFLKEVPDPERYGVAEINRDRIIVPGLKNGEIISIEEKPKKPKSNLAVTGLYLYDPSVFEKIARLKPSGRGEFEITDVNNQYLQEGNLRFVILDDFWSDAGTIESRRRCEEFVMQDLERRVIKSLPEEVRARLPDEIRKALDL